MTTWTAADIPDQTGRLAIVTGATAGLGLATATQLARRGAGVLLAVRNLDSGARTAAAIREAAPGSAPMVGHLDLASLSSVREFAARVGAEHERLDLLVNNAGAENLGPRRETEDGFEFHLGTNMLGHFALTGLLLDMLDRAHGARVVSLSSITHKRAHLDFDDLQMEKGFRGLRAYAASKLATTVFGIELDRRLRSVGSPVASVIAHPGISRTGFTATAMSERDPLTRALGAAFTRFFTQPVAQGALPQLYAATAPDVLGGQFFGPDGPGEQRGEVTIVQPSREAAEPEVGSRLWAASEELTGVTYLS